jgi:hypothetical protein
VSKVTLPAEAVATKAEEVLALAERVESGDTTALHALREVLKESVVVDILGGDLAKRVQQGLIARFKSKGNLPNPLLRESVTRKLELLRGELAGPKPAPLERLLVERVVTCWLHLHSLELLYASQDHLILTQMTWWERCLDRAQKRYLSSIKTLVLVRKLALPVLAPVNAARRLISPPPGKWNGHERNGKIAALTVGE